ncbi:hypothetical protein [Gallaecimonas xiamenensis]|uniref:Putative lipoprotein n=1 Tax=Gallaecimonas xiamenensis 3-C-1 TaxID=745411 RepID=K2ICU0_9GAMM|nr:hypothetical protein [Gallaecimonas xiamenensis]EKE67766.1 putative lipoprotein [Gallaecimonas xiamenensis 3-C-1]
MKSLPLWTLTPLLLAGCCSCGRQAPGDQPGDQPEPSTYFATHISDDGSKRFVFSLENRRSGGRGQPGRGGPGGRQGGPGGQDTDRAPSSEQGSEQLDERLEDKLLESGFCRTGYMELSRSDSGRFARIAGECNESASAEDRQAFPNVGNGQLGRMGH